MKKRKLVRRPTIFAALLVAVLAAAAYFATAPHSTAFAGDYCKQSKGGCGGGGKKPPGKGIGIGIGIGIDVGKIITKPKPKKRPKKKVKKKKRKPVIRKVRKKSPPKKRRVVKPRPRPRPAPVRVATDHVPNEILLSFAEGTPDSVVNAILSTYGLRKLDETTMSLLNRKIVRAFGSSKLSAGRRRQLEADPRVSITLNYIYALSAGGSVQYAVDRLNIKNAHQVAKGNGVRLAVIDSGVVTSHPALQGAKISQTDVLPGKRKIEDSHGTAIASIIAAQKGMLSVAPDVNIKSIRAFAPARKGKPAQGTSFTLVKAIEAAFVDGVQIINMSFAGPSDSLFEEAINMADEFGIILVAAAGNNGPKAKPAYPAAYPAVIAVTATDGKDRLYRHANTGDYVDVAAPGVNVLVAQKQRGYGIMSGTSMASAYVAGAIALLIQQDPALPASDVGTLLAESAEDLGPEGKDKRFGHGIIDIARAMAGEVMGVASRSITTNQDTSVDQ